MPHFSRILSPKFALWIFVLGCLLSSARLVVDTPAVAHDPEEINQRKGQRFAALREALPKHGVVGYIGASGDSLGYYYLTQYALAPVVVDRSPHHAIVIGNFPKSSRPELPENLTLVKDFGNGVLLLANKDAH